MTYKALYEYGKKKLEEAGIEEASLDARLLLEYVCHTNRNELLVYGDKNRSEFEAQVYQMAIDRRAARIPLQHITGEQEFMGLNFKVNNTKTGHGNFGGGSDALPCRWNAYS